MPEILQHVLYQQLWHNISHLQLDVSPTVILNCTQMWELKPQMLYEYKQIQSSSKYLCLFINMSKPTHYGMEKNCNVCWEMVNNIFGMLSVKISDPLPPPKHDIPHMLLCQMYLSTVNNTPATVIRLYSIMFTLFTALATRMLLWIIICYDSGMINDLSNKLFTIKGVQVDMHVKMRFVYYHLANL